MVSLKPPFTADDMAGLFKRVTKGQFKRVPQIFSHELHQILKVMINVNPAARPTCEQLMNIPSFAKRAEKLS
jgi:hypothetical protein